MKERGDHMQEELQLPTALIMPLLAEILSLEGTEYQPILKLSYHETMDDFDFCLEVATYTFLCVDDQNNNIMMELSSPQEQLDKIGEENIVPCENYQNIISLSDLSLLSFCYLLDHPILIKFHQLLKEVQQSGTFVLTSDICNELYEIMKIYVAEMNILDEKPKVHYRRR